MEIAIDFDGTCVTHEYPDTGKDIGAASVLQKLIEKGHNLILFTMRSNNNDFSDGLTIENDGLTKAIIWFKENNIPLYGIQRNPTQGNWTQSPKCYAHLYIDDAALGCPLIYPEKGRPYVDWVKVEEILKEKNIL
jgi:hypothetical protein